MRSQLNQSPIKYIRNHAKPIVLAGVFAIAGIIALSFSSASEETENILVQYKADTGFSASAFDEKIEQLDGREVDDIATFRIKVIEVPKNQRDQIIKQLESDPNVETAEIDHIAYPETTVPNDTLYPQQWVWPKIQSNVVWDKTKGKSSTIVAVIDTGINMTHPDIKNLTALARNVATDTNDVTDTSGHGSVTASIVGASTNNGIGIVG